MRRIALIALGLIVVAIAVAILDPTHPSSSSSSGNGPYLVRAIFDDASFAARGEDVRIAGANVGSIDSLGVTSGKKAAVTIAITDLRFAPFHADATCAIRPQSLIGEEYVDCTPGSAGAGALTRIGSGPGTGTHYLPVARTSSPIDSDIVQDISTEPVRQSLALIINEFGTGLAARGSDLNAVIHRANPALGDTDKVLKILAGQNKTLAQLATDSDTVLAPLAREREHISGFITQADTTAVASAARAQAISQTFQKFPTYLAQLRPLMADLGQLADQGTPLMASLGQSASALGRQFANLTPFAVQARTALINLGAAAQTSQPSLLATQPLANRLKALGDAGEPAAGNLQKLTSSLDSTGGIEELMKLLFNGAVASNGFDSLGHYVRDEPLVSSCTSYSTTRTPGCSANFAEATTASAASGDQKALVAAAIARMVQGGDSEGTGTSDPVVSQAVKSTSSSKGESATLSHLLSFLTGSGK
ncbi:MAG TPA: MlaD family protein [Solirubrobacteraceae bacterium]|nr:MlaD family protein [Solirubrobacteraceae bacterium]